MISPYSTQHSCILRHYFYGQNKIFEQNKIYFRPTDPNFAHSLRNRKHVIYFVWPKSPESIKFSVANFGLPVPGIAVTGITNPRKVAQRT